jgi:hypothetical protein
MAMPPGCRGSDDTAAGSRPLTATVRVAEDDADLFQSACHEEEARLEQLLEKQDGAGTAWPYDGSHEVGGKPDRVLKRAQVADAPRLAAVATRFAPSNTRGTPENKPNSVRGGQDPAMVIMEW